VLLSPDTPLLAGLVGFATLIFLQFIITWLSVRIQFIHNLFKSQPALLFRNGRFLSKALARQRVTESEIRAAIREAGHLSLEDIAAVVLETDGTFSIMPHGQTSSRTALSDVIYADEQDEP